MAGLALTREELIALIDAVSSHRPAELRLGGNARWRQDHEEFCRRFCALLIEALRETGFAWARVPTHGDELYNVLIGATNATGSLHRVGLTAEDPSVRVFAQNMFADEIMRFLGNTNTAVVRRKRR